MSRGDQDSGARGPPEEGHGAVMLLVRAPAPQGTDPGVAVSRLLVWGLCSDFRSIDLRQNGAKRIESIFDHYV